jgi:hypothetical protein
MILQLFIKTGKFARGMVKGITLEKGTISIHTQPLLLQGSAYRTHCEDYHLNIFLRPPYGLEKHFQKASEHWGEPGMEVYTPCVIERRVHDELSHHSATLLAPPGIGEYSPLFVPGLIVPDLKLDDIYYLRGSSAMTALIFTSDYLDHNQRFFTPPATGKVEIDLHSNARYQGFIQEVYHDGKRKPRIAITLSSKESPHVFRENSQKLEELAKSHEKFWWNLEKAI